MKPTDMRGVDEVPWRAEDGHPQAKDASWLEDAKAFTQPLLGHEVQMLEDIQADDLFTGAVLPGPGQDFEIMGDFYVWRVLAFIMVDVARRRCHPAAQFQFHCLSSFRCP